MTSEHALSPLQTPDNPSCAGRVIVGRSASEQDGALLVSGARKALPDMNAPRIPALVVGLVAVTMMCATYAMTNRYAVVTEQGGYVFKLDRLTGMTWFRSEGAWKPMREYAQ